MCQALLSGEESDHRRSSLAAAIHQEQSAAGSSLEVETNLRETLCSMLCRHEIESTIVRDGHYGQL